MARIRRLKPDIWQSADFARLSLVGRLAFVIMITQADDEGRLRTGAHHLALAFFLFFRVADAMSGAVSWSCT